MPKFIKESGIVVSLSQEEVNHLAVVLGETCNSKVCDEAEEGHELGLNQLANNSDLYNFFLKYSQSRLKRLEEV
jgi:hypothetical protein